MVYIQHMQKERVIEVIKDWIQIDNELRELQKISREKRQEKKELTNILVEIMRNNEIDCFDINNGKLIYSESGFNKEEIVNAIIIGLKISKKENNSLSKEIKLEQHKKTGYDKLRQHKGFN